MNQEIIDYCVEEVRRQGRGPLEVAHMLEAWANAMYRFPTRISVERLLRVKDIILWGHLIEPTYNPPDKFRYMTVRVGDHVAPPPQDVPDLMDNFILHLGSMWTPEDAYFEFEYVHPFRDGNGRTGKIILNLLNQTMRNPVWPTNRWGILNP